jgi:formamidopyrimidine-DNA glycosylase
MSGQLWCSRPRSQRRRICAYACGSLAGNDLRFVDQRMFGGCRSVRTCAVLPPEIGHIARDRSRPPSTTPRFAQRLRRKRTGLKRALLDQT